MSDLGQYISIGKVLEVFPETYTATVNIVDSDEGTFGHLLECKVLALKITDFGAASVSLPLPQDIVYVSTQISEASPSIIGYATHPRPYTDTTDYQTKLTPLRLKDPNFPEGSKNLRGRAPADTLPGDDFKTGNEGQTLAILTGGSVVAKAASLCQLILTKTRATALLIARRLKIFTDFGEITSESENGQASLNIRGGSHVKTNNKKGSYDTEVTLGGQQSFKATLPNNFSVNVDKAGNISSQCNSQTNITRGAQSTKIEGDQNTSILGSKTCNVDNHSHMVIKGNHKQTVSGSDTLITLGTASKVINGAYRTTANSTATEYVAGINTVATDPVAKQITIGAGDFSINVGSLSFGSLPRPITAPKTGSFKLEVLNGDINLKSTIGTISVWSGLGAIDFTTLSGNIKLQSLLGSFEAKATTGVSISTAAGSASMSSLAGSVEVLGTTSATLKSTGVAKVQSSTIAEIESAKIALKANVRMLNGDSSTDSVVTALKLTAQLQSKIMAVFNSHSHIASGPGAPTSPPPTQMMPISAADVVNSKKTLG